MAGEDAEGGSVKLSPSTRRAITFHPPRHRVPPAALPRALRIRKASRVHFRRVIASYVVGRARDLIAGRTCD
jgi:hypothetical protein